MRTIAWLIAGLALLGLKGYLQTAATGGAEAASFSLLPVAAMLGASTCFYRALRSALAVIVNHGAPGPSGRGPATANPRAAKRALPGADEEAFDADAAFARYMEQREATRSEAVPEQAPEQTDRTLAPPVFGRRVL